MRGPGTLSENAIDDEILGAVELDPDPQHFMKRGLVPEDPFRHFFRDDDRPGLAEGGSSIAFHKRIVKQLEKRSICRECLCFIIGLRLPAGLKILDERLVFPEEVEGDDPCRLLYF